MPAMRRAIPLLVLLVVAIGIGVLLVRRLASEAPPGTLYGNVEIRQVALAFNAEGAFVLAQARPVALIALATLTLVGIAVRRVLS
jgi:hypothetical protein